MVSLGVLGVSFSVAGVVVDSRWAFVGLVIAMAVARIGELRLARRNTRAQLARGGVEVGAGHYPWMVALHTGFLLACPLEVFLARRPGRWDLGALMVALLLAAATLRWWTIRTLGERWTTRVIVVPGAPAVRGGPFRYFRHPNYLAVIVEMAALPLVHGAVWTAVGASLANAVLLRHRVRIEEEALRRLGDYDRALGGVAGFPGTAR